MGIDLEALARRVRGRFVIAALELAERDRDAWAIVHRVERAQTQRALAPVDGAVRITAHGHHHASEAVGGRARRAQRQRRLEGPARGVSIMRDETHYEASER
jgi:hypothetical protein